MDGRTEPVDREEMWKVFERMKRPVFPIGLILAEQPAPTREVVLGSICETLAAGTGTNLGRFGESLRGLISVRYLDLDRIFDRYDAPTPEETVRLVASFTEAIDRINAWAERHGVDALDTDAEDAAARCGWPDENGNGWNPPWDILRMEKPAWWGTGRDPSETA